MSGFLENRKVNITKEYDRKNAKRKDICKRTANKKIFSICSSFTYAMIHKICNSKLLVKPTPTGLASNFDSFKPIPKSAVTLPSLPLLLLVLS